MSVYVVVRFRLVHLEGKAERSGVGGGASDEGREGGRD